MIHNQTRRSSLPITTNSLLEPGSFLRSSTMPTRASSHADRLDDGSWRLNSGQEKPASRLIMNRRSRRTHQRHTTRLLRNRNIQIILVASIPILALMLILELRTQRSYLVAVQNLDVWSTHQWPSRVDLSGKRQEILQKRLTDLELQRQANRKGKGRLEDRDVLEEERIRNNVGREYPSWWGDVKEVGKSPFDFTPQSNRKRRILFLTDYQDYLERMNTHTYEIIDVALEFPGLEVDVWGPGWMGYDIEEPLSVNVKRRANRVYQLRTNKLDTRKSKQMARSWSVWDWYSDQNELIVEFPEIELESPGTMNATDNEKTSVWEGVEAHPDCGSGKDFDAVWTISDIFKQNDTNVDVLDCGTLLIQQIGDCHESRCLSEWYPYANNITLTKYSFELLELFDYQKVKEQFPKFEMGVFGHSPDTGNEWDFWPIPWSEKKNDAVMFGFDGSFYPIRTTITDKLNFIRDNPDTNQTSLISRHDHPGYTIDIPEQAILSPLETYERNHTYYQTHIAIREDFARAMREARICVFDSSLERKMIRKYAQALLSGCVVASDIPTEHEIHLSKFVIPLKSTMTIDEIELKLQVYLDNPGRLEQMAMDGFIYARQYLTTTRKISDVLSMVDRHKSGHRGYIFPHSFSTRCRAYWNSDDAYRPPWCKGLKGSE